MMDTTLLIIAALIVGLSKGGLASMAAIAVPMLALFMSPVQAAATLLPVYIVTDWVGVWLYRKHYSKRNVWILTPAILLGLAIATVITPYTPEFGLLIFTGLIGLWYSVRAWFSKPSTAVKTAEIGPGVFWGTLTGFSLMLVLCLIALEISPIKFLFIPVLMIFFLLHHEIFQSSQGHNQYFLLL